MNIPQENNGTDPIDQPESVILPDQQHVDTAATIEALEKADVPGVTPEMLQTEKGRDAVAETIDEERLKLLKKDIVEEMTQQQAKEELRQLGGRLRERMAFLRSKAGPQMLLSILGSTVMPIVGGVTSHVYGGSEKREHSQILQDIEMFVALGKKAGLPVGELESMTIRKPGNNMLTTLVFLPARVIRRLQASRDIGNADAAVQSILENLEEIDASVAQAA